MRESRLARRTIKQSKKQLYIYLAAIVIIIFGAINFGPFLIGSAGSFIDRISGKKTEQEVIRSDVDLLPPTLDPLPEAVSENEIRVAGRTNYPEGEVELYVNGSKHGRAVDIESQVFEFENVSLTEGDNFIKARIIINGEKSVFSEEETVAYLKDKPKLEVSKPSNGHEFKGPDRLITVEGKTDPENSVRVNDFVAIVDSEGNFSYNFNLSNGENKLKVVAINPAGQEEEVEITVSYSE